MLSRGCSKYDIKGNMIDETLKETYCTYLNPTSWGNPVFKTDHNKSQQRAFYLRSPIGPYPVSNFSQLKYLTLARRHLEIVAKMRPIH